MSAGAVSIRSLPARYPDFSTRCYAACKLATDPLYAAVYEVLKATPAPLLDLGCGIGLLAFYLRERGWRGAVYGLDYDARKIASARAALARSSATNMEFCQGDARAELPAHCGSVTILDILQFFPPEEQSRLLAAAAERVGPDGMLVIRSGLAMPGWRFNLTRWGDRLAAGCRWMRDGPVQYPTAEGLRSTLEAAGLRGDIRPLWGRTPFNNWLAVFRRAGS